MNKLTIMKKAILFLVLVLSIQTINAHITSAQHTHETFIHEWAWLLIPAMISGLLIWKFSKKSYSANKR